MLGCRELWGEEGCIRGIVEADPYGARLPCRTYELRTVFPLKHKPLVNLLSGEHLRDKDPPRKGVPPGSDRVVHGD